MAMQAGPYTASLAAASSKAGITRLGPRGFPGAWQTCTSSSPYVFFLKKYSASSAAFFYVSLLS